MPLRENKMFQNLSGNTFYLVHKRERSFVFTNYKRRGVVLQDKKKINKNRTKTPTKVLSKKLQHLLDLPDHILIVVPP